MAHLEISYKPTFVRQLKKLDPALQNEVVEQIALFTNPSNHSILSVNKLKGRLAGFHSFSVNFKYRVVFRYDGKKEAVLLVIGDHAVYRSQELPETF